MRGMWCKMLVDSAKADISSKEEKLYVCGQLRTLCDFFPCSKCKTHFKEYLAKHPPEIIIDDNDGLFEWTFDFLNNVQSRLNKPLYDYKLLYPIFHTPGYIICNSSYDFSDKSKMRGMWCKMLIDSAKADISMKEEKLYVCGQLRTLCEFFPCLECKTNFEEHLSKHPPEIIVDDNDGLFNWTFEFLNDIQSKLNKPLYDHKILYPIFHNPGFMVCGSFCTDTTDRDDGFPKETGENNKITSNINNSKSNIPLKTSFIMTSAKGVSYG
jgi:hypothetical protein